MQKVGYDLKFYEQLVDSKTSRQSMISVVLHASLMPNFFINSPPTNFRICPDLAGFPSSDPIFKKAVSQKLKQKFPDHSTDISAAALAIAQLNLTRGQVAHRKEHMP